MATVLPFKGIRPTKDKMHLVASRSVDGYTPSELKDKLSGNPYTFLHVINPDFDDGASTKPGSKERLVKVKRRFKEFIKDHIADGLPPGVNVMREYGVSVRKSSKE